MRGSGALLLLGLAAAIPRAGTAQEDTWPFHGFAQVNWSARTTGAGDERLLSRDFLLGEERLQLELERHSASGTAGFFLKADFFHDNVGDEADIEIREAYVDLEPGPLTLRLGHQIVTWGVGDLLFINDVFPKDYTALFSGRPLEYLKRGIGALQAGFASPVASAEVVATPFFEPDRVPGPDRFVLFDALPDLPREEERPELRLSNTQVAVRLHRRLAGADVSLHAYRGFHGSPTPRLDGEPQPTRVVLRFPRLHVYGASLQRGGFGGVLSAEVGYYDSRQDPDGSDPAVPNSEFRALLGYQRQPWGEAQLGVQYYAEWMQDYGSYAASFGGAPAPRDQVRHLATLRYTQHLAYQTWQLSLFLFLGVSEADYYLIPEVRHKLTEDLWVAVGANVFGGDDQDLFGALAANDNLYLTARYSF